MRIDVLGATDYAARYGFCFGRSEGELRSLVHNQDEVRRRKSDSIDSSDPVLAEQLVDADRVDDPVGGAKSDPAPSETPVPDLGCSG